jgi:hypothetical protein
VAAAFSVKLTARKKHFEEVAGWASSLAELSHIDNTTVEGQLLSGIPTGFLAHSHDLGEEPIEALAAGFDGMSDQADHPRDLVDLVCVADAGTLTCKRMAYVPVANVGMENDYTMSSYIKMNDAQRYGAVAQFIVSLYSVLGRKDPSLRKLAVELAQLTETGLGQGKMRKWDPNAVYHEKFLEDRRHLLFEDGRPRHF